MISIKQVNEEKTNRGDTEISFSDPAFMANKLLPVHRWVPWIAGFSSDFVRSAIQQYLKAKGTILDPFAGVGTTLVEAVLEGHNAIGFEINPYAALVSRVKANIFRIDHSAVKKEAKVFLQFYNENLKNAYTPTSKPPPGFNTRGEFYSPKVLRKVLIVQDYLDKIGDREIRSIFQLAFGATMVRYSNYSYEPSLGRRASSGKPDILDFEVGETIFLKLQEMVQDIDWFKKVSNKMYSSANVLNTSFFDYQKHIEPGSIDLLITSPPYLNNYHYIRNTRPQLYWLGFVQKPSDTKPLEYDNFGTYWQTVREAKKIDLDFEISNCDIKERLLSLRNTNSDKGIYGGNGWANYAATYFNDCYKLSQGIVHSIKHDATALVVIGNSILQGIVMPTDYYFAKIAEVVGLEIVRIHKPRKTRVGSSIINSDVRIGKKTKATLYEAVVELRKS